MFNSTPAGELLKEGRFFKIAVGELLGGEERPLFFSLNSFHFLDFALLAEHLDMGHGAILLYPAIMVKGNRPWLHVF